MSSEKMCMFNSHKFSKMFCMELSSSRAIIGLTVNYKTELLCYQMKKNKVQLLVDRNFLPS